MAGTQQTQEAIDGAFALIHAVLAAGRDGYSFDDLFGHMADGPTKDALQRAWEGSQKIPAELADLSYMEIVGLGIHTLGKVRELSDAG